MHQVLIYFLIAAASILFCSAEQALERKALAAKNKKLVLKSFKIKKYPSSDLDDACLATGCLMSGTNPAYCGMCLQSQKNDEICNRVEFFIKNTPSHRTKSFHRIFSVSDGFDRISSQTVGTHFVDSLRIQKKDLSKCKKFPSGQSFNYEFLVAVGSFVPLEKQQVYGDKNGFGKINFRYGSPNFTSNLRFPDNKKQFMKKNFLSLVTSHWSTYRDVQELTNFFQTSSDGSAIQALFYRAIVNSIDNSQALIEFSLDSVYEKEKDEIYLSILKNSCLVISCVSEEATSIKAFKEFEEAFAKFKERIIEIADSEGTCPSELRLNGLRNYFLNLLEALNEVSDVSETSTTSVSGLTDNCRLGAKAEFASMLRSLDQKLSFKKQS